MFDRMNRRDFLAATAAAVSVGSRLEAAESQGSAMKKALIGNPDEETLTAWKAAGFDGMETTAWNVSPEKAAAARRRAETLGMKIHSVMRAWVNFNSRDPDAVKTPKVLNAQSHVRQQFFFQAFLDLAQRCRLALLAGKGALIDEKKQGDRGLLDIERRQGRDFRADG